MLILLTSELLCAFLAFKTLEPVHGELILLWKNLAWILQENDKTNVFWGNWFK